MPNLEMPTCPRGHVGSRVVRGGLYGRATKRQQYLCDPLDGSPPHRFAPLLPRLITPEGRCVECENPFHEHEGPQTVRSFEFPARTVAQALLQVASGTTYTRAAKAVRDHSRAPSSVSGQLVADWVEAFAPVLWDQLGPQTLPPYLVVDAWRVMVRDWRAAGVTWPIPMGAVVDHKAAFTVVAITGAEYLRGPQKPVLLQAIPGGMDLTKWVQALTALPGRPVSLTADGEAPIAAAAAHLWPLNPTTGEAAVQFLNCLEHLKQRFKKSAPNHLRVPNTADDRAAAAALWAALDGSTRDPGSWVAFVRHVTNLNEPTLNTWLQFNNRAQQVGIQLNMDRGYPQSNSAAEAELRWLKGQWAGRQASYRNEARTNLLLKLVTLHRRGTDDVREWSRIIRSVTGSHGGTSPTRLRIICDTYGAPSLR